MASPMFQALHSLGIFASVCLIMAPKSPRIFQHGLVTAIGLGLILSYADQVTAQFGAGGDLPPCASTCATTAANATGCKLNDTACLCSHPAFASATEQCAGHTCPVEDQSTVFGILSQLCANQTSSSSSSSALSTSSSANQSSTSSSAQHTSQTSQTSASPQSPSSNTPQPQPTPSSTTATSLQATSSLTTPASGPTPATTFSPGLGLPTTSSGSGTVVVVQTVTLPQTSSPASATAALPSGLHSILVSLAVVAFGWLGGAALL